MGASGPEMERRRRDESATRPEGGGGAGEPREGAEENFRGGAAACVRQLAQTKLAGAERAGSLDSSPLFGRMFVKGQLGVTRLAKSQRRQWKEIHGFVSWSDVEAGAPGLPDACWCRYSDRGATPT